MPKVTKISTDNYDDADPQQHESDHHVEQNKFKFKTLSDRLAQINVDVVHRSVHKPCVWWSNVCSWWDDSMIVHMDDVVSSISFEEYVFRRLEIKISK